MRFRPDFFRFDRWFTRFIESHGSVPASADESVDGVEAFGVFGAARVEGKALLGTRKAETLLGAGDDAARVHLKAAVFARKTRGTTAEEVVNAGMTRGTRVTRIRGARVGY